MAKFKKGDNVVKGLESLQAEMQSKIVSAEQSRSSNDYTTALSLLNEALTAHYEKMGSLTTVYKHRNPTVEGYSATTCLDS
jgi:hypothetical protein